MEQKFGNHAKCDISCQTLVPDLNQYTFREKEVFQNFSNNGATLTHTLKGTYTMHKIDPVLRPGVVPTSALGLHTPGQAHLLVKVTLCKK